MVYNSDGGLAHNLCVCWGGGVDDKLSQARNLLVVGLTISIQFDQCYQDASSLGITLPRCFIFWYMVM